ncbi:MAG: TolC family protein [Candidatus Acidoferrales bacterium]|nr:TolC family protein [Candidatus Acidoferrales bacterium]
MTPSRMLLLPMLIGAAIASPAWARQTQQAPQASQRLTVAAAIDLAEKQNLDLAAARAKRAVASAGVRIAGERPNPTLSFGAARDTPHETALIDQPLEIGPKRERRIEVARQESALTEADISALERQLRRGVRDAFFGLAHARAVTAQQEGAVKLAERLHDIAKARFDAGDIPQLEVTQAELEAARAQANRQVAQQEEKVALSGLNALLNEAATTDWDLGDPFAALPPPPALEDVLARAGASNAEIARISQEAKIEQSRKALFEAERIPNLGLQFGADFNAPGGLGANTGGYEVGPRGQLSIELPIFSHNQGEISQSIANARALDAALAAARRAVDAKVESAYFELEARETQTQLYRQTILPSSRQLEEMTEESYRAGKANIMTVLGAQRDVRQVERDYLDSLLAVQSAISQLEEAVGAPLD